MSTGEEFVRWLQRPEKSFLENFCFGLKAWQSAEFTLSSKYELMLQWLSAEGRKLTVENIPYEELTELLQLRAQPGLIDQRIKETFVEMMLEMAGKCVQESECEITCIWPKLLYRLCEFEILQDLYRTNYELHARVYAALFNCYDLYLRRFKTTSKDTNSLSIVTETDFFASVISSFRGNVKRTGDAARFDDAYRLHTLQPLIRVILVLRTHSIHFLDELIQLERLLTDHCQDKNLVERVLQLPLYARLVILECAIVNRRGVEAFLQHLLQHVFQELPVGDNKESKSNVALSLSAAAYTLEILRKHDVNLNFQIELEEPQSALVYLGAQLLPCIRKCKQDNLREVLMLLCAALRLNPLILEQDIYQITTWMIVAEKTDNIEQDLFEEYLVSILDMFRRLSRCEKLVFNILTSLKEWLRKFELPSLGKVDKKLKRKAAVEDDESAAKKFKITELQCSEKAANDDIYLRIIFGEFHKLSTNSNNSSNRSFDASFPYLRTAWPSVPVGVAFSNLITGLVSKPAIVIWKSLLYSLNELLEQWQQQPDFAHQKNNLLLLDVHTALLCQYFAGCRLVEQCDKFANEITEQLHHTTKVLAQFGRLLVSQEYNKRTMSAFLECAFHTTNFELILVYYCPDGFESKQLVQQQCLHKFLTTEEWTLLQQRVLNFGKSQCKFLLKRLLLQRTQTESLLQPILKTDGIELPKCSLSTFTDQMPKNFTLLLQNVPSTKWFIFHLQQDEKTKLLQQLLDAPDAIQALVDDLETLEILAVALYARLSQSFAACKRSMLAALNCNFDTLCEYIRADSNTAEKKLHEFVAVVDAHKQSERKLKKLPLDADIQKAIKLLRQLPLGHLRRQSKNLIFTLHLAFYSDLKAATTADMDKYAAEMFEIIMDFLHFGQHVPIFKYFSVPTIIHIMPITNSWKFYEFVFATIKSEEKGSEQFLTTLTEILHKSQTADGKLVDENQRLMLITIETMAVIGVQSLKRLRHHFESILDIFAKYVNGHFNGHYSSTTSNAAVEGCELEDKQFVENTLAGFASYANALLVKATSDNNKRDDKATKAVDDNFRRICKIYIGHSMDYRNPHAIRLMQVALNHRQLLHLDQDEIEFVLSHYWQQLTADLKASSVSEACTIKTTQLTVKMIIGNKTNEDFLLTLQSLADNLLGIHNFSNILRCLELIAKCPFSTVKGAIFNDKFKSITCNVAMRLIKDDQQQFSDTEQVLAMLAAKQAVIENKMIPISIDTLDNILAFLMDINIKRFTLTATNGAIFKQLHLAMAHLLGGLIRQRHILLMDRVPQFMHIFKDLIQSVVWYKSDRQKDVPLAANELDDLADLAIKLETLMHSIAVHSIHVKRVAPFVLTFVINLMVANKRATTLYPKIKTHIDNICYGLIGICDHRVGRFILRCSNEAARQVYELYVKDHKKYHKFKGKV